MSQNHFPHDPYLFSSALQPFKVERVVDRDSAPSDMQADYPGDEWPAGKRTLIFKQGRTWELSEPIRLIGDEKRLRVVPGGVLFQSWPVPRQWTTCESKYGESASGQAAPRQR